MNIKQVLDSCKDGTVLYRYQCGICRYKIIGRYTPNHTAFMLDMATKSAWTFYDWHIGFFLTEKEAIDDRKECIRKQISNLQNELDRLK